MARIVIVVPGITSVVNANLALALRLREAGHSVAIASPAEVAAAAGRCGFEFIALEPMGHVEEAEPAGGRLTRWLHRWRRRAERQRARLDALGVDSFAARISDVPPDLVLVHIEMAEHVIAAWSLPCRMALVSTFLSIWKGPQQPPLHKTILPGVGWSGSRPGIEAAWLSLRLWKWATHFRALLRTGGVDRLSILRLLARETGFPFRDLVVRYDYLMPYSYRQLPVITLNALELDYPGAPPPDCRYVGPMILLRGEAPDARLASLLDRFRDPPGTVRPLVYCGFGSFSSSYEEDILRRVIRAAEGRDWELVVTLGGSSVSTMSEPLPDNVHLFDWVPQPRVLALASCAIIHGGTITINECVHFGVPMLLYPLVVDTFGNSARASFHGLGILGDRDADTPRQIAAYVDELVADPMVTERVNTMRRDFARYQREAVAERAIDQLVRGAGVSGGSRG